MVAALEDLHAPGAQAVQGALGAPGGAAADAAAAQAALIAPPVVAKLMRMLAACSAIRNANLLIRVSDQYAGVKLP